MNDFSFEFFPPRNDQGVERLLRTRTALATLNPAYFSVTFGAGGSTRDRTRETVAAIQREGKVPAAPHISCIAASRDEIHSMLEDYRSLGVRRIVALRGDLPSGSGGQVGDFRYANELVAYVREAFGDTFQIEVGAYPEKHPHAKSIEQDVQRFVRKAQAGADQAITQYFYNLDAYIDFVDQVRAHGCDIPIVPGIMPILNSAQLLRFSDACGAEIPRYIRKRLEAFGDDTKSIQAFGLDVVTRLCEGLLDAGAPGLHFYSMNQEAPMLALWDRLGLAERSNPSA